MDTGSQVINSEMTDKELGMNFCEKYMRAQGKDLRSIFWVKTDEKGHHHFEVAYTVEALPHASSK